MHRIFAVFDVFPVPWFGFIVSLQNWVGAFLP